MRNSQTQFDLPKHLSDFKEGNSPKPHSIFISPTRPSPTIVYDTYWKFACLRQDAFYNRIENQSSPSWSKDKILTDYKFTNAYRVADRVSQYLIKNVIYNGSQDAEEIFFRTILFKLFNKIETWEYLESHFGSISWREFRLDQYDAVLDDAISSGTRIYSAAYIMASAKSAFGRDRKHSNHLLLLQKMMNDRVPLRLQQCNCMESAYKLLLSYPGIGPFLAYQYVIDLNYSTLTNFSENEFVMPGPGSLSGISKCFADLGDWKAEDVIKYVTEHQDTEFERLGLSFKNLWGRSLHLIDCQNLFCEVDKYSRINHPEFNGKSGRTRIKQIFRPILKEIKYWFPPKWGISVPALKN